MSVIAKRYRKLIYATDAGVATITFNNPSKMNCIDISMRRELLAALREAKDDQEVKVIIITGAGEKAFCVGADIHIFEGMSSVDAYRLMSEGYETHRFIMEMMGKPLIAAVNGYCLAGGLEIALACDFIFAVKEAEFGLPEVNLGIIPSWGGCVRLPRAIGVRHAKEIIMSGRRFNVAEADRLGLINRVLSRADLIPEARKFAAELAAKSLETIRMIKTVINLSSEGGDIDAALALERSAMSILKGTKDCAEAVKAFLEKRSPKFTGE